MRYAILTTRPTAEEIATDRAMTALCVIYVLMGFAFVGGTAWSIGHHATPQAQTKVHAQPCPVAPSMAPRASITPKPR